MLIKTEKTKTGKVEAIETKDNVEIHVNGKCAHLLPKDNWEDDFDLYVYWNNTSHLYS